MLHQCGHWLFLHLLAALKGLWLLLAAGILLLRKYSLIICPPLLQLSPLSLASWDQLTTLSGGHDNASCNRFYLFTIKGRSVRLLWNDYQYLASPTLLCCYWWVSTIRWIHWHATLSNASSLSKFYTECRRRVLLRCRSMISCYKLANKKLLLLVCCCSRWIIESANNWWFALY